MDGNEILCVGLLREQLCLWQTLSFPGSQNAYRFSWPAVMWAPIPGSGTLD